MSDGTSTQEEVEGQEAPQWVKELRKQNKELKERVDALAPLQRENLLLRKQVDLDAPTTKLFVKGWDGDWNDAEAVGAAIQEYSLPTVVALEGEAPTGEQSQQEQAHPDAQAHQRIEQAGGGAPAATGPVVDYSQASTPEEVIAAFKAGGGYMADDIG